MTNSLSTESKQNLEIIAGILIRCFVITVAFMLLAFAVMFFAREGIYEIHYKLFQISKEQYNIFILDALTLMKILGAVFFFIPYIAIRLYIAKYK